MKFSTITLALVSGMASIASAERPKSNGRIINPMINDSSKPMSAVEEQGQRHLQGKSSKSTSSTKSGKSKSSKSAGPCDMLGMGCTITAAAGNNLGNECTVNQVLANNAGDFQCNTGQPFGETGSFLFNANIDFNGQGSGCLRFSNCGENANNQGLTIESDILRGLERQCEACREPNPIRLTCTEEFLFAFRVGDLAGNQVPATLCGGISLSLADVDSFNCASGRFVFRGGPGQEGLCFQNEPGGPVGIGGSPQANRQAIIDACRQCPNAVTAPAAPATRAQPVQQASSITGSELRLSTPMAATKTTNGGVIISGVTCLSASILAVAAFGVFIF